MRSLISSCLLSLCLLAYAALAVDPLVKLSYAQYAGTPLSNGITQWLGIPFAAPPTGNLRFAPPADPTEKSGVQQANQVSTSGNAWSVLHTICGVCMI